jgi:putative ABC transport system permease protein
MRDWREDVRRTLDGVGFQSDQDASVVEELAQHLEDRYEDLRASGLAELEAQQVALEELSGAEALARLRPRPSVNPVMAPREGVLRPLAGDVRLAVRTLWRRPAFTGLAVLTLGLGIGAITAVISVTDWLLFQPIPGAERPEELVRVEFVVQIPSMPDFLATSFASYPELRELADATPALASLAGTYPITAHITLPSRENVAPLRMRAGLVSRDFAATVDVRPQIGRVLTAQDAEDPRVVMIGDGLWNRLFQRESDAIGSTLLIYGVPFTVVGVAPRGFTGSNIAAAGELWMPVEALASGLATDTGLGGELLDDPNGGLWNDVIGRLAPGHSIAEAEAQLRTAADRLAIAYPEGSSLNRIGPMGTSKSVPRVGAGTGLSSMVFDVAAQTGGVLRILAGIVALLLLLACANAANLLFARATARRNEMAVRAAIGAGRGHLVWNLLIEAVVLALVGGVAGVALALGGLRLFEGYKILPNLPALPRIPLDGQMLMVAFATSLVAAILFGIAPSVLAVRDLNHVSRDAAGSLLRSRPARALLIAQVALSFVLVVGSALLLDTLRALRELPLGFEPEAVLEATVDPAAQGYDIARVETLYRGLLDESVGAPGIVAAGLAQFPVMGGGRGGGSARPEGLPADDPRALNVSPNRVSHGLLAAVGLELIEGRDFRPDELFTGGTGPEVAILTEAVARHMFPGESAVGQRIDRGNRTPRIVEVVGVVGDARLVALLEPVAPMVFEPFGANARGANLLSNANRPTATFYFRGRDSSEPSAQAVGSLIARFDPTLPPYDVQPLSRRVDVALTTERLLARITALLGALALMLASIGLYAVMSSAVHGRTRELGVRRALGASAASVRSMVLRDAMRVAVIGVVLGAVLASQLSRFVESRLFGVRPLDPWAYFVAAGVLIVAAAAATFAPARRATRVDPIAALRIV